MSLDVQVEDNQNEDFFVREDTQPKINWGYLSGQIATVSIGMIIFGYSITSWNVSENGYFAVNFPELLNTNDPKMKQEIVFKSTFINTLSLIGAACGALMMGPMMTIGRRNCIMLTNLLVLCGSLLCLLKKNMYAICVARFLFGAAAGCFSLFCPKYLSEIAPIEYKGPIGCISQINICVGMMIPNLLGLFTTQTVYGKDISKETQQKIYDRNNIILCYYPIMISSIQMCLLLAFFPFDTPVYYKNFNMPQKLNQCLERIYQRKEDVERIITELGSEQNGEEKNLTYKQVLFSKKYSQSSFVGIVVAFLQQMTGINFVMMYSNKIAENFQSEVITPQVVTASLGVLNVFTVLIGTSLLFKFGRKTILFWTYLFLSICLFAFGFTFYMQWWMLSFVTLQTYAMAFQLGPGPVTWLYIPEITQDKASSIATATNWISAAAVTLFSGITLQYFEPYWTIWAFGVASLLGTFFIHTYLKETQYKTIKEIEEMFDLTNNDEYIEVELGQGDLKVKEIPSTVTIE